MSAELLSVRTGPVSVVHAPPVLSAEMADPPVAAGTVTLLSAHALPAQIKINAPPRSDANLCFFIAISICAKPTDFLELSSGWVRTATIGANHGSGHGGSAECDPGESPGSHSAL